MAITTHLCRGNFRVPPGWRPGGLRLRGRVAVQRAWTWNGFFLEYDDERSRRASSRCGSSPRASRSCSAWSRTKRPELEVQRRPQAPHRPGGQVRDRSTSCACSGQCGFASTEAGQRADARRPGRPSLNSFVETAAEVWGITARRDRWPGNGPARPEGAGPGAVLAVRQNELIGRLLWEGTKRGTWPEGGGYKQVCEPAEPALLLLAAPHRPG